VITDDWIAAGTTEPAGRIAHHHTTATAHRTTVVAHDRDWLPRDGEPAAVTTATGFGCTACSKSKREADC